MAGPRSRVAFSPMRPTKGRTANRMQKRTASTGGINCQRHRQAEPEFEEVGADEAAGDGRGSLIRHAMGGKQTELAGGGHHGRTLDCRCPARGWERNIRSREREAGDIYRTHGL